MKKVSCISAFILASTLAIMPMAQGENVITSESTYTVNFTGKETFTKLIKDGKYHSVDEELTEINSKFSAPRKGEQKFSLVSFQETMPIEDLVVELKLRGLRPATVIELLAFGIQYPNEQLMQGRPILSPAATILIHDTDIEGHHDLNNEERVNYIYLRGVGDKRILGINAIGSFWNKNWRCLAAQITETESRKGR